jgi:integrase
MSRTTGRTFNFTDQSLRALPTPPKPEQLDYFDLKVSGLGLRISYGGRRSFFVMYSNRAGKRKRASLGEYGQLEDGRLSLAAARKQAKATLGDVASGGDPAREARAQRQAPTVQAIAADWLEAQKDKGRRSWERQAQMLDRDILPSLGTIKGRELERRHVKAMLRTIKDRPAPVLANRAHEVVRAMLNWALLEDEYGLESNVALKLDRSAEHKGERWLTSEELGAYWNALDHEKDIAAAALRLCLLTAQRQGNVVGMRRDQLALGDRLWLVPASTTKTGRIYKVPLSEAAAAVIESRLAAIPDGEPYLFPLRRGGEPVGVTTTSQAHRRVCKRAGIEGYPCHAHRRTFGHHCDMMKIPRLVWDGILGHIGASMAELYSGFDFAEQRLDCANRWADRIAAAVSDNVVPIRKNSTA